MIAIGSATGNIKVGEVDETIFIKRYSACCLDFSCLDICCSYGCQMDMAERDRILCYARELEASLAIPPSQWFEAEVIRDADYPSGEATRSRVNRDKCVFYDHKLRGCYLHRFAAQKGIDRQLVKPMICSLFPITWERGRLFVSSFLDELPCRDQGVSIFEAQKDELIAYFGRDFVSQLEQRAFQMNLLRIAPRLLETES